MAKYAISNEGASALDELAKALENMSKEVEYSAKKLKLAVLSCDGLGIYREPIEDLVDVTIMIAEKLTEDDHVKQLILVLRRQSQDIKEMVSSGLSRWEVYKYYEMF